MAIKGAFFTVVAIVAVFGIFFGVGKIVSAFTEPPLPPPAGNVPAPINVGGLPQTKAGSINAQGGLFDGGVSVCRSDGENCPAAAGGRPTVLRYVNPPTGSWLGPADFCALEYFEETRSEDRDWCKLAKSGNRYQVHRRYANCAFVCLRW